MKKIVIFGAGRIGRRAIKKYGKEKIAFIIDNDNSLYDSNIEGIEIKSPDCLRQDTEVYRIVIASRQARSMIHQLSLMGIDNYEIFDTKFNTGELIINPYDGRLTDDWNGQGIQQKILDINEEVAQLCKSKLPIFSHIEIETINRCNGECSFCPVNKKRDPRPYGKMEIELFHKIILELKKLEFDGSIVLFSNNEPFLDSRITEFIMYAREHLNKAFLHISTNGTLLTVEKLIQVIPYLDEIVIDNYNQQLELNPTSIAIVNYCENHQEVKDKVKIILRRPKDVLTSRGGDAPNSEREEKYPNASCLLPFKQIVIRPDGKVSLCCNDALGKCTLGDVSKQTLEEIWYGNAFRGVRSQLKSGRSNVERCRYCDTVYIC